jgi:pimeloyl-[acyl-carrier protein] methyl ester esterase
MTVRHLLAVLLAGTVLTAPLAAAAAQAPAAAQAAKPSGAVKLFTDSRMVVRDRISVEVVGRGPDIVLIPGLASSRETWRATAERLRGRYRLHLVNVAGFAGEPARGNAGTGPVVVPTLEDIDGYIVAAKLHRPMLIGHSLGGTMSLALAERHPEHISKVLIVDALPFFGALMGGPTATSESVRPIAEGMMKQMSAATGDYRTSGRPMIQAMVTAPADVDRVLDWGAASDRTVVGRAMAEDLMLDLRPGLATLTTPVTLLYPDSYGQAAAPQMVDAMYKGAYAPAKTVKLIRIDTSRHFIMFDQPQRFAEEVDRFLAK